MNISLKSDVLYRSIQIENFLSKILMVLLDIENPNSKILGHSGTALSFKSKADLLYDIKKISLELYNDLLTFMEIRNQFIHNDDTNTYEFVINQRINRKKNFLNYIETKKITANDNESKFKIGFEEFTIDIVKNLEKVSLKIKEEKTKAFDDKVKLAEKTKEAELYDLSLKVLSNSIDEVTGIFGKRFKEAFNDKEDIGEKLKNGIQRVFEKRLNDEMNKNES